LVRVYLCIRDGMGQLISLIEINIGKDLQYIRFNGTLIGGLAGLALYTIECCCGCYDYLITGRF
jgi:hypothetical protein